jgi:protein-S-isoprenylcysteine O-methyltransferase Ste14
MATIAFALCVLYAAALFGIGEVLLRRRTGSRGWARAASPTERGANALVFAAWLLDLLGPALVLAGAAGPLVEDAAMRAAGAVTSCLSLVLAVVAQRTMGTAWRSGIDPGRPSELVTSGLFALVRNPVYTTMVGISVGAWLLVPTAVGALGVAMCVAGLEVQTRLVEEPYLRGRHGERFERYASRAGRFVPGIGRMRRTARSAARPGRPC